MNDANHYTEQKSNRPPFGDTDLREVVAVLRDRWRWVATFGIAAAVLSVVYALSATPIYRTNALLQVEEKSSGMGALGDFTTVLTGNTQTEAEREIIRSRSVLGAAIEKEKLYIDISPMYFPIIGRVLARQHDQNDGIAEPLFGLDNFAWGGERIQVDRLTVSRSFEGATLILQARPGQEFSLSFNDEVLLVGQTGVPAAADGISIYVAELVARPETRFRLVRHNWLESLDALKSSMGVAERGRQTGILELTLDGPSPLRIASVLKTITDIYLRQNVERTSEDAAKTLEFLDQQLPVLKQQLDGAEASLNQYRVTKGSVDLSLETQGLLQQIADTERQLSELELKQAELSQRFTEEHPVMAALQQQRVELNAIRVGMQSQIRSLPEAEQDSLRLMRDVQVANELYMLLLNRAQELKVVRAGTVGNVRIIDNAFVPLQPFKPQRKLLVLMGTLIGLLLGMLSLFFIEIMNPAIRDSDDLEKAGGLPVYAIVPHSAQEDALNSKLDSKSFQGKLLLSVHPDDAAIESLRSLRTSLEFLLLDAVPKIITIGGPAPGAGKSFVTANLAALFVQTGKKVLLIDSDLRRGHLHRIFGLDRRPGLAEVISGRHTIDDSIRRVLADGLDFISTGTIPPNPSELIISRQFKSILDELGRRYDIVFLDAPPVLGAAESVSLARLSTINLLVVRSERQTPREVALALSTLKQGGAAPKGFVLNDLHASSRHNYAGYHYYRYHKK